MRQQRLPRPPPARTARRRRQPRLLQQRLPLWRNGWPRTRRLCDGCVRERLEVWWCGVCGGVGLLQAHWVIIMSIEFSDSVSPRLELRSEILLLARR